MAFQEDEYLYLEKYDVYLEWELDPRQNEEQTTRQLTELSNYLFDVEDKFLPEIEYIHGRKVIKSLGSGMNGIAFMSKGQYVIKLTGDKTESDFALTIAKEFEEWPSIFTKVHKIMVSKDYSILWKDYALDLEERVDYQLLAWLYKEIWKNPDNPFYKKYSQGFLQARQTTKLDKLSQKFANDFIELAKSHNLKSNDTSTNNVGLSSKKDRLVIFDFGGFTIDSEYKITEEDMNRIIDLSSIKLV